MSPASRPIRRGRQGCESLDLLEWNVPRCCVLVQVLVKGPEGSVEHLVKVCTYGKVLEELRVSSKLARQEGSRGYPQNSMQS